MKKILATVMLFFSTVIFGEKLLPKTFESVDGKVVTLESLKGKPTYIKAWAHWCPICLSTLEGTNELSKEYKSKYNIVTVVFPDLNGEYSKEDFKKWWEGLKEFNDTTVLFAGKDFLRSNRVRGYPFNMFLDKNAKVVFTQYGALDDGYIVDRLENLNK